MPSFWRDVTTSGRLGDILVAWVVLMVFTVITVGVLSYFGSIIFGWAIIPINIALGMISLGALSVMVFNLGIAPHRFEFRHWGVVFVLAGSVAFFFIVFPKMAPELAQTGFSTLKVQAMSLLAAP